MAFFSEQTYQNWMDELANTDFVVINDFIDAQLYETIFSFFDARLKANDLLKAGIGSRNEFNINEGIRGDYVYWLNQEKDHELSTFYAQIAELIDQLKYYCFLGISDYEAHLAYYPAGTFYHKHLDQFKGRGNRLISFVLYLNPAWKPTDGGELIIYQGDETLKIEPKKGRLVLFKSDTVLHEVSQTNAPRYSLTGWMLSRPAGLGFL